MSGDDIGIVIIGRNEGERLRRSLQSVPDFGARIYVDSGSTDGSQQFARSLGFTVLDLDRSTEFTAARARNLGICHIAENFPAVRLVQTIDGDCELVADWVAQAAARLRGDEKLAVVFGRRRERFPDRNLYHRACEIEWNVPVGAANSCGGDALFRLTALIEAGGYNPRLISGEEPDLCYRLRRRGWSIYSDGCDMTRHDVDITSMKQWWRRALRAGHGIAELVAIHGRGADKGWDRFVLSGFLWSGMLLLTAAILLVAIVKASSTLLAVALLLVLLLVIQVVRTGKRARMSFHSDRDAFGWGGLLLLSKLAQLQGTLLYWRRRLTSSRRSIIEYK